MTGKKEVLKNPAFTYLEKIGHKAEDDIYTWSQGLGFHNHNLLNGLKENVNSPKVREAILSDVWKFFYSAVPEKINRVLGVEENPDVEKINKLLNEIMHDKKHSAISGIGDYIEEAFLNWVKTFAIFDFAAYTYLEKHLGAKEALRIYMGLWETFALAALDNMKKNFGIKSAADIDMDMIGKLSRAYWESISGPYRVTRHTKDVHEAEIVTCPYWVSMKALLGEGKARSMTLKTEAVVSVNYYDAILKALGVFDKYSFTMDKFACCGDDCCRVRFEHRK
jgi:hypothetical protein